MSGVKTSDGLAERRTIDRIPEAERHGSPRDQFTLWFGANLQITAVLDGALAVVFGAEAMTAIIGLAIGNILGGIVMALHSAQGPRLGLPQMISSRAQFGVKGATLPLLLVILMYLGFAATGTVLAGQALNLLLGSSNPAVGMIVFGVLTCVIALVGYKVIHIMGRIATVISIIGFAYLSYQLFHQYDIHSAFGQKPATVPTFLLAVSLSAGWQLTYAPYVADYSRYLPSSTADGKAFFYTLFGSALASQLAMTFGVLVAALGAKFLSNQVGFLGTLAGEGAILVYVVIVCGKLTINCLNAYGGFMAILTTFTSFSNQTRISKGARAAYIIGFVVLSVLIAVLASSDFLSAFKNFVLMLLAVFVPWSAINLVDYYLISKEKVDIPALYDSNGRYGAYNWTALGCYILGVVVQIPLLNQPLYEGPIAIMLNDADISWAVGLIVTAVAYYLLQRNAKMAPSEMILDAAATAQK
ncbi:purine-cytosine permease family protein [Rhizobium sp. A22-96]